MGGDGQNRSGTGLGSGELPRLAFISSVINDELQTVRKRVVAALGQAPFLLPWAFEMTPASSEGVGDDYLRKVREATLVFWFAGARTTHPVEREVAEALATDRRLLVFVLPAKERDRATEELLARVGHHARYRELTNLDGLEAEVELAVADELARALDGEPSASRAERLDSLGRESRARCIQRWVAAGIDPKSARELAGEISTGAAPEHLLPGPNSPLVVLVAEAGCGKSLACERVLQAAIVAQLAGVGEPVPVYVTAREAVGRLKDLVTAESQGLGDPDRCGAVVLIDGADEAADGAALLLAEARELAYGWPRTRVLLGTRPLSQFDRIPEARKLPRLDDAQARRIVGLAAGREITQGEQAGWSAPTRDAATVPLFALLIGRHIAMRGRVGEASRTSLLAELAERGLEGAGKAVRPLLQRLAVASIARGGGRVPRSELGGAEAVAELESSRLISISDGEAWFPLALIAQWFAAASLAGGEPGGVELAENTAELELWRYPLAILAATAGHREVLAVFGPLAEAHPGFISQVVEESIVRWPGSRGSEPPRQEAGMRIREAMAAWLTGLGPLGSILQPRLSTDGGRLPPLGIEVEGDRLLVGWYAGEEEPSSDIVSLPVGVRIGEATAVEAAAWPRLRGGRPPQQASWAMRFTFDDLRGQLESTLHRRSLPLEGTSLEAPRLWRAARGVLGLPDTHAVPIDLSAVIGQARGLEASGVERPWRVPGQAIDLQRLIRRLEELLADGVETFAPPPLEIQSSGGVLLSLKTRNELTLDHVRAVYDAAIQAYVELTDSLFASLRPFMQIAVLLPAVLRGHVYLIGDPAAQFTEHLEWWLDPLPPGRPSEVDITGPEEGERRHRFMEGWDEEADEATVRARAYRPAQARWIGLFLKSGYLEARGPLAVEEIVYEWLWSDLQRIKWVGPGRLAESVYKTLP